MITRTRFDASLDVVEIDLLCTFAGVRPPFPLQVRSTGATATERTALFGAARQRLTGRGLATGNGPGGAADLLVYLLRNCRIALDLRLSIRSEHIGALLLAYRGAALLVVRDVGDPAAPARLAALPPDRAVEELLWLVPDLDAAMATPFTLPKPGLDRAYRVLRERAEAGDPLGGHELHELLSRNGIDERLANRMGTLLQPVLGSGQAGLTERGGYAGDWRRVGEELHWLDAERGRFRLAGTAEWTSVNPLFANELSSALRRLAASVGG